VICTENPVNSVELQNGQYRAKPLGEGVTTSESVESSDSKRRASSHEDGDIVCSAWEHAAA
jgi:hypothetical protein